MDTMSKRLELRSVGDGRTFLNYWSPFGNDAIFRIDADGKVYRSIYREQTDDHAEVEVDLAQELLLLGRLDDYGDTNND